MESQATGPPPARSSGHTSRSRRLSCRIPRPFRSGPLDYCYRGSSIPATTRRCRTPPAWTAAAILGCRSGQFRKSAAMVTPLACPHSCGLFLVEVLAGGDEIGALQDRQLGPLDDRRRPEHLAGKRPQGSDAQAGSSHFEELPSAQFPLCCLFPMHSPGNAISNISA